jgi:hypothetical protein
MLAVGGPVAIGQRGLEIDLEVISRLSASPNLRLSIVATLRAYRRYASVAALLLQRNAATRKV